MPVIRDAKFICCVYWLDLRHRSAPSATWAPIASSNSSSISISSLEVFNKLTKLLIRMLLLFSQRRCCDIIAFWLVFPRFRSTRRHTDHRFIRLYVPRQLLTPWRFDRAKTTTMKCNPSTPCMHFIIKFSKCNFSCWFFFLLFKFASFFFYLFRNSVVVIVTVVVVFVVAAAGCPEC